MSDESEAKVIRPTDLFKIAEEIAIERRRIFPFQQDSMRLHQDSLAKIKKLKQTYNEALDAYVDFRVTKILKQLKITK